METLIKEYSGLTEQLRKALDAGDESAIKAIKAKRVAIRSKLPNTVENSYGLMA